MLPGEFLSYCPLCVCVCVLSSQVVFTLLSRIANSFLPICRHLPLFNHHPFSNPFFFLNFLYLRHPSLQYFHSQITQKCSVIVPMSAILLALSLSCSLHPLAGLSGGERAHHEKCLGWFINGPISLRLQNSSYTWSSSTYSDIHSLNRQSSYSNARHSDGFMCSDSAADEISVMQLKQKDGKNALRFKVEGTVPFLTCAWAVEQYQTPENHRFHSLALQWSKSQV